MNKQNLDSFFKNKFENFEEIPPQHVWENLEIALSKKKKRRVIPLWWKFSGVAALFILGFGFFYKYNNSGYNNPIKINTVNKTEDIVTKNIYRRGTDTLLKNQNVVKNNSTYQKENQNNTKNIFNNDGKAFVGSMLHYKKYHIRNKNNVASTKNNSLEENKTEEKNALLKNILDSSTENNIAQIKNSEPVKTDPAKTEILKDSAQVAQETQELEKLLKNEKEEKIAGKKVNRWQLIPQVAPIYFGSTGNNSPLDERLKDNTKHYNNSYSYGLGVHYTISKKIEVRTGVNYLTTNYDTNEVLFYQKSYASKIQNINPTPAGEMIEIESLKNVDFEHNKLQTKNEGVINQEIAYIEMPVEVSYKLIDKKFGINVITGMSTLFLNQNNVYLKSPGLSMRIGEANNLNNVNFSANLGLGLRYKIYKNLSTHVEPILKYQLKTFSNDVGNFKPYVFGIYSGISLSF